MEDDSCEVEIGNVTEYSNIKICDSRDQGEAEDLTGRIPGEVEKCNNQCQLTFVDSRLEDYSYDSYQLACGLDKRPSTVKSNSEVTRKTADYKDKTNRKRWHNKTLMLENYNCFSY